MVHELENGVCIANSGKKSVSRINKWWILLESEATNHAFRNHILVKYVKVSARGIRTNGHDGNSKTHNYGTIEVIGGRVWLHTRGIAYVISLPLL